MLLPELDDARSVLFSAWKHVCDLQKIVRSFHDKNPYKLVIDIDSKTRDKVHKIRLTDSLPGHVRTVAKDALSNLRDALDYAVYASTVALGKIDPTKTGFPFADNAIGVHNKLNGELTDVPPVIRTLLETFRPHYGPHGNRLLVVLNKTRNIKTHRKRLPLVSASAGNFIESAKGNGFVERMSITNVWSPANNEAEFLRTGPNDNVEYKATIVVQVVFGDVPMVQGEPAVPLLYAVHKEVSRIVGLIEAEVIKTKNV